MSDFNFRKPLSNDKKTLSEALAHINKVYNSNFSPVTPDKVDMTLDEATIKTVGGLTFRLSVEGSLKAYIITNKKGEEIGHIKIGKSTKSNTVPHQLFLGKQAFSRQLVLNLYPDSPAMRVTLQKSTGGKPTTTFPKNKVLEVAAQWIEKNHKNMLEEVEQVEEAKEDLKVVKKEKPTEKKSGKTTSEFNGDKRGFNRFVEEQDVEEIEEEEDIEEGVRVMNGAEKMIKDDPAGGSSLASSFRKIKKVLEGKPAGSVMVVTKEKSPESMSVDIYEPSDFKSLVNGLSKKPEAKVGSKGSWSGGEVTVVGIKEEAEQIDEVRASYTDELLDAIEKAYKKGGLRGVIKGDEQISDTTVDGVLRDMKPLFGNDMEYAVKKIKRLLKPQDYAKYKTKMEGWGEETEQVEGYGNPFTPQVPGTFAAPFSGNKLKAGDKVKVPHKGKMVSGKIVRYDDGGTDKARQSGGGYVVDVGEPASILVPKHKVQKEEVEQIDEVRRATKDADVVKRVFMPASPAAERRYKEEDSKKPGEIWITKPDSFGQTRVGAKNLDGFVRYFRSGMEPTAKKWAKKREIGKQVPFFKDDPYREEVVASKPVKKESVDEASNPLIQNPLNIARKTVKMNDVMIRVMGGMSKKDAHEFLLKHGTAAEKAAAKKFLGTKESLGVHMAEEGIEEAYYSKAGATALHIPAKWVYDDMFTMIRERGVMFNRLKAETALEYIFRLMCNPRSPYSKFEGTDVLLSSALIEYKKMMGIKEEATEETTVEEGYRMQDWARFKRENPKGTPVFIVLNGRSTLSGTLIDIKPYDLGIARKGYFVSAKTERGSLVIDDVEIMNIYFGDNAKKQIEFNKSVKSYKSKLGTPPKAKTEETEMEGEEINEAYISTDAIKIIREDLKREHPKFKFMIARERNSYSSIRVAIVSGPVAFVYKHDGKTPAPYADLNVYYPMNYKNGEILKKILATINKKNWDRSDISTDYFDVGFYLTLTQGNRSYGSQERPFTLTGTPAKKLTPGPTPAETKKRVDAIISKIVNNNNTKNAVTGKSHTKAPASNAGGPGASRYGVFEDTQEVNEKSPPSGPARKFSKDPQVKADFKKKYGERWKEVMYATAWKMHNK
jgi:hypothetical protein